MTLVRWDPFREFSSLEDRWSKWFRSFDAPRGEDNFVTYGTWIPPVDIYENAERELVITAELPGVKREDIQLTVEDDLLTLGGERKFEQNVSDEQWHRVERGYGKFSRTFALPSTVDAGKVTAEYRDGTLTVKLPLREEAKPKRIAVKAA